jgi:DNA-directed RNA polymerase alpha subunit
MKLVLDKKHGNRIEWVGKSVPVSMANMIRRYGTSRLHILAIDSVTFYDNTSAFWDEYIAHRLGLFPVTTPDKVPEDAEVLFSLDAEGPKVVYASDMTSSDKDITISKGNIPIVTLGPNQHLRFEGKAVVGTGKQHAKFQSGLVSYGVEGDDIKFMVESFYQMTPAEVIVRACDVIESDIEAIEEALGKKSEKKKKKAAKPKKEKKAKEEKEAKAEKEDKEEKEE